MGNLDGKPGYSIGQSTSLGLVVKLGDEYTHIVCVEALHLLSVASEDEYHLAIQVLNLWKEVIQDCSAAEAVSGSELIGFIDEQYTAAVVQYLIDDGLAARHSSIGETSSSLFFETTARDDAERSKELSIDARNRGFPWWRRISHTSIAMCGWKYTK